MSETVKTVKPSRVVVYVRASTEKQEMSPDVQLGRIKSYCSTYDHSIVGTVVALGESGKPVSRKKGNAQEMIERMKDHRPKLVEALTYLDRGDADALIVAKLDRLTRSVRDLGDLLETYFMSGKYGLLSVGDQIDTRSATGRFMINILGSVSQWERETIVERTKAALAYKRSRGEFTGGQIPYGWKLSEDKFHIEINPVEQSMATFARSLREEGTSLRDIGEHLRNLGQHPKGGGKWHAKTIQDLLETKREIA